MADKKRVTSAALTAFLLSGCTLSPDFSLPDVEIPAFFKENPFGSSESEPAPAEGEAVEGAWKKAAENVQIPIDGKWWAVFGDETLNALIAETMKENPSLQAAAERMAQAKALAGVAESDLYPQIGVGAGAKRSQSSANAQDPSFPFPTNPLTTYAVKGNIDYGLDLFGMARANYRASAYGADAAEASYRAGLLLLQAQVAETYFMLRSYDQELDLLNDTVRLRAEAQELTRRRVEIGEASDLDTSRTEAELASTKAEAFLTQQKRAAAEHMLATLTGKPPASFHLDAAPLPAEPPAIPPGLPSTLLERRPDIQAAQKEMASANERIGVARAAFFPRIDLTAGGGFESRELGDLFKWSSRSWILGPLSGTPVTLPVFDGGRNRANLAYSKASFRESVAKYREKVLVAFREVEDALSNLHYLTQQEEALAQAAGAAKRSYDIAKLQYETGYAGYLELMDAQRVHLGAERGVTQARGQRYAQTVQLIRALGGQWGAPPPVAPKTEAAPPVAPKPEEPKQEMPAPVAPAPVVPPEPSAPQAVTPSPAEPPVETPEPVAAPVEPAPPLPEPRVMDKEKAPASHPVPDSQLSNPPEAEGQKPNSWWNPF